MMQEKVATPRLSSGPVGTPYAMYAEIATLHSLQKPRTDASAETSFIVATQVMELLFGLLRHEWVQAQRALRADDLPEAMEALRRGLGVQDVLIGSWDLLATLTPSQFNAFRGHLGEASGFQSHAYRHLEFLLGNKSAAMLRLHQAAPEVHTDLTTALNGPSLYDDVLAVLDRHGLRIPLSHLERDWTAPYEAHAEVEKAWQTVYTSEAHRDLERLAELLLDVAERVTRWRQRHQSAVKRAMGAKPGTAGSSGLSWLRKAVEQDVFPELWTVRNEL
jgi:tryptophan 2,3-dioxygenase